MNIAFRTITRILALIGLSIDSDYMEKYRRRRVSKKGNYKSVTSATDLKFGSKDLITIIDQMNTQFTKTALSTQANRGEVLNVDFAQALSSSVNTLLASKGLYWSVVPSEASQLAQYTTIAIKHLGYINNKGYYTHEIAGDFSHVKVSLTPLEVKVGLDD